MGLARYPFTNQVNAMTHVIQIVHTWNLFYMCLVIYKIRIRLDGGFHSLEVRTFLQFHIHHTAMDTGSHRNSHGQSILHSINGTDCYGMPHAASRTEIGISNALRSDGFQQCTNYRIASRIPSGRNNSDSLTGLCRLIQ